jgi:hypothetical protein
MISADNFQRKQRPLSNILRLVLLMNYEAKSFSLSGWLLKLKRNTNLFTPNYGKRYVTVRNFTLSWQDSPLACPSGTIDIQDIINVYILDNSLTKGPKTGRLFVIKSLKRDLVLLAKTKSDAERWVIGIKVQMQKKKEQERRENQGQRSSGNKFDEMVRRLSDTSLSIPERY